MICMKCKTEMFEANLVGANFVPVSLTINKRRLFDIEKRGNAKCFVCPECGYIELQAIDPKKLLR
ncbi:MAG: hypothetical protein J6U54_13185 [Clostridiales bacterium]|nr:hypothetical protein [Clostridiales bacterium]